MARWRKDAYRRRYRQIARVLARHGLGYLVGISWLERFFPFERGLLGHAPRAEPYTPAEHVRLALEQLGTTFIKLGQLLSIRPDLLPPDYQAELARLQDQVPPLPVAVIREALATEFGRPLETVFACFDDTPLAAASIGQVHAARLPNGAAVAVKVRRPGVAEQVEVDLAILRDLAAVANRRWEFADRYDLVGLAEEFSQTLRGELDYLREGRNAERFAANFAGYADVHIPRVAWEATTTRVLTLERLQGVKITDLAALDASGIDRAALAERAARLVLKMIFDDGFFHADPHPGNFFIEPDGRIGLLDFGMVGTVDARTREQLAGLLLAVVSQDSDRLVDAVLALGAVRGPVRRDRLRRDLDHLITRYWDQPLGELALGPVVQDVLAIIQRHHLQLPSTLALLLKTVVMSEGLGQQLDPRFRVTSVVEPYARQLLLRQYSPVTWGRRLGRAGLDATSLAAELPQRARRLLGELERGELEVGMRPEGFTPVLQRLERLANRIVLGVLTAAFINGLAILLSVYHPLGWARWVGAFFAVGFTIALVLGIYLAWSILRSERG